VCNIVCGLKEHQPWLQPSVASFRVISNNQCQRRFGSADAISGMASAELFNSPVMLLTLSFPMEGAQGHDTGSHGIKLPVRLAQIQDH
jgi:hypothetical protein